ncbi:MAG: hypothetical protein R2698_01535 [Microthrixaceae bacterium]
MTRGRIGSTGSTWRGARLALAVLVIATAGCAPLPAFLRVAPGASASTGPIPVVIVHGWQFFCGSETRAQWTTWFDAARARGYDADLIGVFSYDTCHPTAEAIEGLGEYVKGVLARTGATQVDMIGHSMGSIVGRACIRFGSCAGKVRHFASIAGINHGTVWANVCAMAFWSASTCDLKADEPFLTALNAGDETWGDTEYVTMISWCDLTIVPFTSAHLDGALNMVDQRCLSHTDWRNDPVAANWVLDWFAGRRPDPATIGPES